MTCRAVPMIAFLWVSVCLQYIYYTFFFLCHIHVACMVKEVGSFGCFIFPKFKFVFIIIYTTAFSLSIPLRSVLTNYKVYEWIAMEVNIYAQLSLCDSWHIHIKIICLVTKIKINICNYVIVLYFANFREVCRL